MRNTRLIHCLHSVTAFVTFRYLQVDQVAANERFIVRSLGIRGVYVCIVQYGYSDSIAPDHQGAHLVAQVLICLQEHILADRNERRRSGLIVEEEISMIDEARSAGVVHVQARTAFETEEGASLVDKVMLRFSEFLHRNCRPALPRL